MLWNHQAPFCHLGLWWQSRFGRESTKKGYDFRMFCGHHLSSQMYQLLKPVIAIEIFISFKCQLSWVCCQLSRRIWKNSSPSETLQHLHLREDHKPESQQCFLYNFISPIITKFLGIFLGIVMQSKRCMNVSMHYCSHSEHRRACQLYFRLLTHHCQGYGLNCVCRRSLSLMTVLWLNPISRERKCFCHSPSS